MNRRQIGIRRIGAALVLASVTLAAQASPWSEAAIPVTDPETLAGMGFAPDTDSIYALNGAFSDASGDRSERVGGVAAKTFGTDGYGMVTVGGHAFRPISSAGEFGTAGHADRYCTGTNAFFDAPIDDLPHGARIAYLDQWYFDDSAESVETWLWATCTTTNGATPSNTMLDNHISSGTPGSEVVFGGLIDETINTERCFYWVRVRLDDSGGSCSESVNLRMRKVRLYWQRQISPAPGSATFDDVSTGHPFFQHVEALAASGITAGCGGGDFCPDAPLTRGQMAVFLAKALGLHWQSELLGGAL